ncbi:MAG: hypothetical protein ACKOYM_03600, partial [Actinomycetes bacterium]
MPFAFAVFWLLLRVIGDTESDAPTLRRDSWVLGALTVFLTLLLPATTLALLAGVPVYLLVTRRWRIAGRRIAASFWVPGLLVCVGQVLFLRSDVSPYEQAKWLWKPFWHWHYFGLDRPAFWTVLLFYPLCWWAGGRRWSSDPAVKLSAFSFVLSLVPFMLIEHTTVANRPDGDLGVIVLMASTLLFLASLRFVFNEFHELWQHRDAPTFLVPPWAPVIGVFLGVMLCAGVVDFLSAAGVIPEL